MDKKGYSEKAKNWTDMYAKGENPKFKEALKQVMEMGFTDKESRSALEKHEWNVEQAINSLIP